MAHPPLKTSTPFIRAMVSLAVVSLATLACNGEPKNAGASMSQPGGRVAASGSRYSPLNYRLDEAKVHKVAAVMREWDPTGPPPKSEDPNELAAYWAKMTAGAEFGNKIGRELLNENSTATIDSTSDLKVAIERQGLSSREFVEALLAYTNAMGALDIEGLEKVYGKKSEFTPTGVFKENVELIRRMNKEEDLPAW